MQIITSNIYNEFVNFSFLTKQFEENYENMYSILLELKNYWYDNKFEMFSRHIDLENIDSKNIINELNDLKNVYRHIYDNYSKIGNKISFEENNILSLMSKCENCIYLCEGVLKKYENLLPSINSEKIVNEYNEYKKCLELLKTIKLNLNSKIKNIQEIESNVKVMLSKINIEVIKESDIHEFL